MKSFTVLKVQEIPLQEEQVLVLRLQQMWRVYTEVQFAAKSSLEGTVFSVMLPSTHEENIEDDNHAKQEVSDES